MKIHISQHDYIGCPQAVDSHNSLFTYNITLRYLNKSHEKEILMTKIQK